MLSSALGIVGAGVFYYSVVVVTRKTFNKAIEKAKNNRKLL